MRSASTTIRAHTGIFDPLGSQNPENPENPASTLSLCYPLVRGGNANTVAFWFGGALMRLSCFYNGLTGYDTPIVLI